MADSRLEKELSLARRALPSFGLGRQQQVIWAVRRRVHGAPARLRRLLSVIAAACLVSLLGAAFVWVGMRAEQFSPRASRGENWELRDGSRISMESPDTRITKQRESNDEVTFELEAGAARFDVAHRPERTFRVQAGLVLVEVLGTRFRVERRGAGTVVSVERGRVRVSWPGAFAELAAGEQGAYPPAQAVAAAATERVAVAASAEAAPEAAAAASASAESVPLAARPSGAGRAALAENPARAASAEELFAAADRARAAGHPQEAKRALRELTERFPRDGRAPFAAFTLGRLLLENLGQPAEAARAFAEARALAGGSSALAEDALAREAVAWRAAGRLTQAAERATLYRTLYPRGAHLKEVLRAGELSPER